MTLGNMAILLAKRCIGWSAFVLPAVIAIFLIMRALWDQNVSDWRYAVALWGIFAGCAALSYFLLPRVQKRWRFKSIVIWGLPVILILPATVVTLVFGSLDMSAFLFHAVFGTEGAPLGSIFMPSFTGATYWLIIVITILRFDRIFVWRSYVHGAIGCAILVLNPMLHEITEIGGDIFWARYEPLTPAFLPTPAYASEAASTPDIIFIYLEGVEAGYGDTAAFGNSYAPIDRLAESATQFTRIGQAAATGWSLAGTIATQCGSPLIANAFNVAAELDEGGSILPNATCLSDITRERGYVNLYLAGSELIGSGSSHFGYGNFLTAHGVDRVIDRSVLLVESSEEAASLGGGRWGFHDEVVFERALEEIDRRASNPMPFFLSMSTIDTHGPEGFLSPSCRSAGIAALTMDMGKAVACSTKLAEAFVRKVLERHPDRDMRIVVMSDHLAHHSSSYEALSARERFNTVLFIMPDIDKARTIERPGTMLDVYPTVLDWLGWLPAYQNGAGLGRSLFRDPPTLVEKNGLEQLNKSIRSDVAFSRQLWASEVN